MRFYHYIRQSLAQFFDSLVFFRPSGIVREIELARRRQEVEQATEAHAYAVQRWKALMPKGESPELSALEHDMGTAKRRMEAAKEQLAIWERDRKMRLAIERHQQLLVASSNVVDQYELEDLEKSCSVICARLAERDRVVVIQEQTRQRYGQRDVWLDS